MIRSATFIRSHPPCSPGRADRLSQRSRLRVSPRRATPLKYKRASLLTSRLRLQQPKRRMHEHLYPLLQGILVYREARVVVRSGYPLLLVSRADEEECPRRYLLVG